MGTLEFTLFEGVTKSPALAAALGVIARAPHARVNLTPSNTVEDLPGKPPSLTRQERFADVLRAARVSVTLRREKGHDIDAACGQLKTAAEKKSRAQLDREAEEKFAALG